MRRPGLFALIAMFACLIAGGAYCGPNTPTKEPPGATGWRIPKPEQIGPATAPPKKAVLSLSGSPFPVEIRTRGSGTRFEIVLYNQDEEIDREEYENSALAFRLVFAGGEHYDPPIDLLKYPVVVGQPIGEWTGKILSNGNPREAKATVETEEDTQFISGAKVPAVKVTVTLVFPAVGGDEPARRVLSFWFAKDKGLFRREYDWVSTREPAP